MKKIYAIAALFLAASTTSYAQRAFDLELSLTTPVNESTVPKNSAQPISFTFKHTGDAMVAGDTVFLYYFNLNTEQSYSLTGVAGSVSLLVLDAQTVPLVNSGNPIPSSALNNGNTLTLNTNQAGFNTGDEIMVIVEVGALDTNPGDEANIANNFGSFILSAAVASIDELNTISLSAFPNPAVNELNVTAIEDVVAVSVINLEGKVVASANGNKVDVSNLNSGVYMYEATTVSGLKAVNKFVKL